MARSKVRRNSRGIEQVAKSREVRAEVNKLAERVADAVRAQGIYVEGVPGDVPLPVEVVEQTTDRARAQVRIAHASGKAVQAKHGVLTKAAAQAGLDVKAR
jgi:hypothetical protein